MITLSSNIRRAREGHVLLCRLQTLCTLSVQRKPVSFALYIFYSKGESEIMNQQWIHYLQKYSIFRATTANPIAYHRDPVSSQELEPRYSLEQIAGNGDAFSKSLRLMQWISHSIRHNGAYGNGDSQDALTLLSRYYHKKQSGINCLALSIVLTECCLALSIPARVVYMMPYDTKDIDNHVVVEIYWDTFKRWVMLDPTYCCYIHDGKGTTLSLMEIRSKFCCGHEIFFSDTIQYNGENKLDLVDIQNYYIKNLFFLRCRSHQIFGEHRQYGEMIEIAPDGFDVHTRMVENLKYRIAEFGSFPILTQWLAYEMQSENPHLSPAQFYESGHIL